MNDKQIKAIMRIEAAKIEAMGYEAENTHRLSCGNSIAYGAEAFIALSSRMKSLVASELTTPDTGRGE